MLRALHGKSPRVDPTAYVSEAAYVVGDVEIGPHASVWPGAVIRADHGRIVIGARTNVQDGSVVHGDADVVIGSDVTIGHRVVCHAARVDDHALLGNGCVVNDGALIGAYAIVASGAMVLERVQVPPETIYAGVPATLKGRVMARHRALIERTADSYVELAARYKADGL